MPSNNMPPLTIPHQELLSLAIQVHQQGHTDTAEEIYQRVLGEDPRNANALHFLGILHHSRGQSKQALKLIQTALKHDPKYVAARINAGNVLKELERFSEAESEYRIAIRLEPQSSQAHNNLGTILRAQDKIEDAIKSFQRATELAPDEAGAFQNLGNALKKTDRIEEALTAFRRAIEIDPTLSDAHLDLGRALYRFGRVSEAKVVYEKWLEIDPENPIAQHMLLSCGGDAVPQRCSDEFVKESFDAFADSFDEVLRRLDYQAPAIVGETVRQAMPAPSPQSRILDVGCGTGLCASMLKPYSRELVGIDLSPKMVDKAKELGLYDQLEVAELTGFMLCNANSFDLIVAADTLVYFGILSEVFLAAAHALRKDGQLIFTVEAHEDADGYRLHPHGRYSHSRDYVCKDLVDCGFELLNFESKILRQEVEKPVNGYVVTARLNHDD